MTPAIISLAIFEESQRVMVKAREARPLNTKASYLLTGFIKCGKCGSPVGGTTLGGKYRYYQCRGAKPTITRDKICSARYINADEVEDLVWERVLKIAGDPLMGMKLFLEANFESDNVLPLLDRHIKDFRASVKKRWLKEKELYSLLEHDAVTKEFVLDAANEVKKKRLEYERQLEGLEAQVIGWGWLCICRLSLRSVGGGFMGILRMLTRWPKSGVGWKTFRSLCPLCLASTRQNALWMLTSRGKTSASKFCVTLKVRRIV